MMMTMNMKGPLQVERCTNDSDNRKGPRRGQAIVKEGEHNGQGERKSGDGKQASEGALGVSSNSTGGLVSDAETVCCSRPFWVACRSSLIVVDDVFGVVDCDA